MHVVDRSSAAEPPGARLDDARAQLDAQARRRRRRRASAVRTELVVGAPDEALVAFAETEGCDLIVIAARSTSSSLLAPRLHGGEDHRAHRACRCSSSAIRRRGSRSPRGERPLRLLLGIDDSVACDLGIQWTQALRQRGPIEVVLGAIYYPDDAADHYGLDRAAWSIAIRRSSA